MMMAAVLLAVSVQAAAEPAAYPSRAVLDAFRAACSKLDTLAAAEKQAVASGWTKVADPAATPVAKLVAFGQAAGADMMKKAGGRTSPMAVFARSVAGEQLHLVLSGVTLEGRTVNGCRLYDVDETRRIAPADAEAWLGRKPVQTIDQSELTRTSWEPGMVAGQDSFEVYHVPQGSPVIAMTQLSGIALKADQVKGAK